MDKLPNVCKDCAEYGSHFCEECLEEVTKDMPEEEKAIFSKALQNLAHSLLTDDKK